MKQILTITVTPRSTKNELKKQQDNTYKARLTAAPVDGEANKKLIELISKELGISKSLVRIIKGQRGRKKVVAVGE